MARGWGVMAGKINQLVESVTQYADVLQQCSTAEVAQWKVEDLERAFNWVRYFQKVSETRHGIQTDGPS